MSKTSKCCGTREDAGRSALAGTVLLVGGGTLAYTLAEMSARVVLKTSAEDGPGMLLWGDAVAASIVVCVSVLLFLPDCCRFNGAQARQTLRRERNTIGFLLLAVAVITSITSRARHLNMSTSNDESRVCGRRDAVDACPSQRIKLSHPYDLWRRNNEDELVCWFNTTAVVPDAFLWGEQFEYAEAFPTADFGDPATYDAHPQYAPCYYYGCSKGCLPGVRAHHDSMLRIEVAVTLFAVLGIALSLCGKTNYDYSVLPKYEN